MLHKYNFNADFKEVAKRLGERHGTQQRVGETKGPEVPPLQEGVHQCGGTEDACGVENHPRGTCVLGRPPGLETDCGLFGACAPATGEGTSEESQ